MAILNQSLTCFEQYQVISNGSLRSIQAQFKQILEFENILFSKQKNHSELCKDCKTSYKRLNELYGRMEKNQTLCIDIEDAVSTHYTQTLSFDKNSKLSFTMCKFGRIVK